MSLLRLLLPSLFGVLLFSGCGGAKPVTEAPAGRLEDGAAVPADPANDRRAEVMRLFMDATQARLTGQLPKAITLFNQCLKLDPQNAAAMFELAKIHHASQDFPQALDFAKRAVAEDKENIWYRFLLADLYQQGSRHEDAIGVYREILQKWPDRYEVYFDLANTLAYSGKVTEAIKVYEDVERKFGLSEEVMMQQFTMLTGNGKLDEAEALVKRALQNSPNSPQYNALLAELYDQRGEHEKALVLYQQVLAQDPSNSMLRISLAEHYYATGRFDDAYRELGEAFLDPELDIDAKMQVLIGFFEMTEREGKEPGDREKLVQRSYDLIKALETAHPESGKPHTIHGDFLLRDQKFAEAREQFRKALQFEKDRFPIHLQLLQLDLQLNDHAALEKDADAALELFPTQPEIYLYKGLAQSQLKKHDEAVESLVMGRDLVVDNPQLQAQFWSSLGDAYNEANEHDKSIQAYDRALAIEPNNPNTLNNYAYHLSERGEELQKAEEMSRKSNELAPGQPSYLDTYAWVLFRLKKFAEARTWIEKAIQSGGADQGVIVEHYGDILYALGDAAAAMEQWRKAKDLGDTSPQLDRKINEGKFLE
jgi:tetratricopeptide (TPR) repeat protein